MLVAFGRGRNCTPFERVFGRVSCGEIRRQGAPQDEGHGEERQQRKSCEQKDENGEGGHRWRPGSYCCGWPFSVAGSSSRHILRRYDAETEMRSCFEK